MKPIQPQASTSSSSVRPDAASIPGESNGKVFFTHHSVEFVMDTKSRNEVAKVHCDGKEHLIDEVWQCPGYGHLMCRKCCFRSEIIPETCPNHKTRVFIDKCAGRLIRCQQVTCPANDTFNANCPWSGQYNEVISHLNDCTFIPGTARVTMQNAMVKALQEKAERGYEKLQQETSRLINNMREEFDRRCETIKRVSDQQNHDLTEKCNQLVGVVEHLSRQLTGKSANIAPVPLTAPPPPPPVKEEIPISCNGTLIWPITNFSSKLQKAKTDSEHRCLDSPEFYTSESGYRVRARLYPNGDGMGRGTHVSIFLQIMNGPFDGILSWPFKRKVTFMILDQDHVEHVLNSFNPNPESSSFRRPRAKPNTSSGCPTFMLQTELNSHAYLREDTLFVKAIIDPPMWE